MIPSPNHSTTPGELIDPWILLHHLSHLHALTPGIPRNAISSNPKGVACNSLLTRTCTTITFWTIYVQFLGLKWPIIHAAKENTHSIDHPKQFALTLKRFCRLYRGYAPPSSNHATQSLYRQWWLDKGSNAGASQNYCRITDKNGIVVLSIEVSHLSAEAKEFYISKVLEMAPSCCQSNL